MDDMDVNRKLSQWLQGGAGFLNYQQFEEYYKDLLI